MENLNEFVQEVKNMETTDIMLILEDQLDLYSEEEIEILRNELADRPSSAEKFEEFRNIYKSNRDEAERRANDEKIAEEERERQRKHAEKQLKIKQDRINALKNKGEDCYYEYMSLTYIDNRNGCLDVNEMITQLNEYSLLGWRLKTSITNELGKNSNGVGVGGFSSSTNATIEETILILERKVKI